MKDTLAHRGCNMVKEARGDKNRAMYSGHTAARGSHDAPEGSQLGPLEDKPRLGAPPGYYTFPSLPVNTDKVCLAAAQLALFLCRAGCCKSMMPWFQS